MGNQEFEKSLILNRRGWAWYRRDISLHGTMTAYSGEFAAMDQLGRVAYPMLGQGPMGVTRTFMVTNVTSGGVTVWSETTANAGATYCPWCGADLDVGPLAPRQSASCRLFLCGAEFDHHGEVLTECPDREHPDAAIVRNWMYEPGEPTGLGLYSVNGPLHPMRMAWEGFPVEVIVYGNAVVKVPVKGASRYRLKMNYSGPGYFCVAPCEVVEVSQVSKPELKPGEKPLLLKSRNFGFPGGHTWEPHEFTIECLRAGCLPVQGSGTGGFPATLDEAKKRNPK